MKKKMIPLADLRAKCDGWGLSDLTVQGTTPEDLQRLRSEIAYLEGRFATLDAAAQEKCRWRATAVAYAHKHLQLNRAVGRKSSEYAVAMEIGCSSNSLKRWRVIAEAAPVGLGYLHLYMMGVSRHGTKLPPEVYLFIEGGIRDQKRPRDIAKEAHGKGWAVSLRTVQRLAAEMEAQNLVKRRLYLNRFK